MKRVWLAGLLGGVAMFVWMSIAHMALPVGQIGIREIPNEAALVAQMHATLGESPGLYLYPGMGSGDMKQYDAKLATTPSGLLVYNPPGNSGMTPGRLIIEFGSEVVEAMLLAWLMAHTNLKTMGSRLGFALGVGVAAGIATNISYWNWYGFPATYTAVSIAVAVVGYLAAGLVAAKMLPRELSSR